MSGFRGDPTARRRWGVEAQFERDVQIWRLYQADVTFRAIASRVGCSLGTVQNVIRRERKREAERELVREVEREVDQEFEDELAGGAFDKLTPKQQVQLQWDENEATLRDDPTNELCLYRRPYLRASLARVVSESELSGF